MDIYYNSLMTRLKKNQEEEINLFEYTLTLKELLKYRPADPELLLELGGILFGLKHYCQSFILLCKSNEIRPSQLARKYLNRIMNPDLPTKVTLEPLTICNLKCPLCYYGAGLLKRKGRIMTFDNFRLIWDKLKSTVKKLVLEGQGETFLHQDIYRMLDYVGDSAWTYIDTNGNAEIDIDRLLDCGLDKLVFSIDGINQEMYARYRRKGNFERAVNTLRRVVETRNRRNLTRPEIEFKFIFFKHTEMYEEQARQLSDELGADSFHIEPCTFNPRFGMKKLKEFMPLAPKVQRIEYVDFEKNEVGATPGRNSRHCLISYENLDIDVDGEVYPCCALDRDITPSFGNLLHQDIEEIWYGKSFREFRLQAMKNRLEIPGCRACTYRLNDFSRFLEGTVFENPPLPEKDASTRFYLKDNRISADEIRSLIEAGRENEAEYFINLGKADIRPTTGTNRVQETCAVAG